MIELSNICKHFEENKLFDNFSEIIQSGEFVAFVGKSGCGKTTLLNMIGGLEKPNEGHVFVNGIDIYAKGNLRNYFKNTVGFLFQNFALIEDKTVEQNLNLIHKSQRTEMNISEVLEKVGLCGKEKVKVYKLSGGEQQRVALARLMLKRCSVILADEPTGSLDYVNANIVMDILKEMNTQGKTIVLVTHDERVMNQARRVIYL